MSSDHPIRRHAVAVAFAALVLLMATGGLADEAHGSTVTGAEHAAAGGESTTTTEAPLTGEIIPKPNSGVAPTDPGDRGGALQTLIFVLVMGGTAGMAVLVWRQSKKARAARGF